MAFIELSNSGYFLREGSRFVPVGVNYWPASCGLDMWNKWPEDELLRDLDRVASLGLNTVRFFLMWQDFESEAGHYNEIAFTRLAQFLGSFAERGLLAHPALFVGFMSGQTYWPSWKSGGLYTDPMVRERSLAFASRVGSVLAPFADSILAVDLGNEMDHMDENGASSAEIGAWCAEVALSIRTEYPDAIMISGTDHTTVIADSRWHLSDPFGYDLLSMHGYPTPMWHSVDFDGMTDPLCQSILPFYTQFARAHGPVMLQEFGTLATGSAENQDQYLRGMLPHAWNAGANGFLWWCMRDIVVEDRSPYTTSAFETTFGLLDRDDRVKPGLDYFLDFCRDVQNWPVPEPELQDIGLYVPRHYYMRGDTENPGNNPKLQSQRLIMANYLLRRIGCVPSLVLGGGEIAWDGTLLVCGSAVDVREAEALRKWVEAGGRLIWQGVDAGNLGLTLTSLLGQAADFLSLTPIQSNVFGREWEFSHWAGGVRLDLSSPDAEPIAKDARGRAIVYRRKVGLGQVVVVTPAVEDTIAATAADRDKRDGWADWYAGLLSLLNEDFKGPGLSPIATE